MLIILIETDTLRVEMESGGGFSIVRPRGVLDEKFLYSCVIEAVKSSKPPIKAIQFDLGSVTRINSVGVRNWVLMISNLLSMINCEFLNIGELFMEQASMVPGILADQSRKIISFYVPFHCSKCSKRTMLLKQPENISFTANGPVVSKEICATCNSELDLDCVPEQYFSILME